ncbi:MAG: head GIN domain-containing protein [Pseudomonadota bacterium]
MSKLLGAAFLASALAVSAGASASEETITETRPIDARTVKIKLGGVIELRVKQGATPSLVLTGDKSYLQKVTTTQYGDTLQIDMEKVHVYFSGSKHTMRAELTLPNLKEFISTGVGSTEISGFTGEALKISLDGAGAMTVNSQYKNLDARLTGVGSMTLNAGNSDKIDLLMKGAGHVELTGQVKSLHAKLGGLGGLDAQKLQADAVDLDMSGLGGASVYAKNSAVLNLSGMGSATVYGKPSQRTTNAHGMGSVSWQ